MLTNFLNKLLANDLQFHQDSILKIKDTFNVTEIINLIVAYKLAEISSNLFVFRTVHVVYGVREGKLKRDKIASR